LISNVPLGSGLSSSAALEVAAFHFFEFMTKEKQLEMDVVEKARICQKAEHDWAGVPCGLMDQLVSFAGRENQALLIDCRTKTIEYVPVPHQDKYVFVVTNSNVKHEHASNEYSNRKSSCEQVASLLAKSSLRDISMRELESSLNVLPDDLYRIGRHVITENERTLNAADALKRNDLTVFGALMTQVSMFGHSLESNVTNTVVIFGVV
jgi:galactokinase